MDHAILKYPVGTVQMPKGARILSVQAQRGSVMAWALVDPSAPMVQRDLVAYATGFSSVTAEPGKFLATVQLSDGDFVLHVFDQGERPLPAGG